MSCRFLLEIVIISNARVRGKREERASILRIDSPVGEHIEDVMNQAECVGRGKDHDPASNPVPAFPTPLTGHCVAHISNFIRAHDQFRGWNHES